MLPLILLAKLQKEVTSKYLETITFKFLVNSYLLFLPTPLSQTVTPALGDVVCGHFHQAGVSIKITGLVSEADGNTFSSEENKI